MKIKITAMAIMLSAMTYAQENSSIKAGVAGQIDGKWIVKITNKLDCPNVITSGSSVKVFAPNATDTIHAPVLKETHVDVYSRVSCSTTDRVGLEVNQEVVLPSTIINRRHRLTRKQ